MKKKGTDDIHQGGKFQKLGIILAVVFYIVSVIMVIRNYGGVSTVFDPGEKMLTIAHWQLEDGFREGIDEAISEYEKTKAKQGVKVKVRQVAIPVRGYPQWFLTQLIGGDPADVIELMGSPDILNQYFSPLSPYISQKNPWNKGTPIQNMSWRETFTDDMLGGLDPAYSEYFGVSTFMHTTRVYVNLDLYEKATGTKQLPDTVTEWLDSCKKMREYGVKTNRPVIPIGVRGFDKGTLGQLFNTYNSQLNTDLADVGTPYSYGTSVGDMYHQVNTGKLDVKRLLEPVKVVTTLGQYFAEGFPAIDLEQTKYLFFSGNVGFFIDGTWNAFSMINNAPFKVGVMQIPMLSNRNPFGLKSYGRITELGSGIGGMFGIPKKTKNFDLALDFLQFLTSWKVNQMVMVKHCKWMSPLKGVKYEGVMKTFEPVSNTSHTAVFSPFFSGALGTRLTLQRLENSIIERPKKTMEYFWNDYLSVRPKLIDEVEESSRGIQRNLWSIDGSRSALAVGSAISRPNSRAGALYRLRSNINLEGIIGRFRAIDANTEMIEEMKKLKEYGENGN